MFQVCSLRLYTVFFNPFILNKQKWKGWVIDDAKQKWKDQKIKMQKGVVRAEQTVKIIKRILFVFAIEKWI